MMKREIESEWVRKREKSSEDREFGKRERERERDRVVLGRRREKCK
jgi:hypothetical protein